MACDLLHIVADPDTEPYADPEVKDIVGHLPKFSCTRCQPPRRLKPSEALKCLGREGPCWKPEDRICD
ncbi:MAG: hypothetical protein Kow0056_17410 [Coriobacteriia bacterium]